MGMVLLLLSRLLLFVSGMPFSPVAANKSEGSLKVALVTSSAVKSDFLSSLLIEETDFEEVSNLPLSALSVVWILLRDFKKEVVLGALAFGLEFPGFTGLRLGCNCNPAAIALDVSGVVS